VTGVKTVEPAAIEALRKELTTPDAPAETEAKKQTRPDRMLKLAAKDGGKLAVAYWGGTLRIVVNDKIKTEQQLPQDATALAWLNGELVVGLADGQVLLLKLP
jgi:hypothetical protein